MEELVLYGAVYGLGGRDPWGNKCSLALAPNVKELRVGLSIGLFVGLRVICLRAVSSKELAVVFTIDSNGAPRIRCPARDGVNWC